MKTFTKSVVALMAMTTAAFAADLPSRSEPKAPAAVVSKSSTPFFVGVSGGSTTTDSTLDWSKINNLGVRGGYEFNSFIRTELTYDYTHKAVTVSGQERPTHLVATNAIAQYKFGPVTPYALGGFGYRFNKLKDEAVFNVGGGVRYDVAKNFEADLRYRYVADFDRAREDNILAAGFNYKF
jgi:opacity protein-like surface antigen